MFNFNQNSKMEVPDVQLTELVDNINKFDFVKLKNFIQILNL